MIPFLQPYDNFMHHTFVVFVLSCLLLIIVSVFTKPKPAEELVGVVWTKSALGVAESEKGKYRGFKSLKLWWILMVLTIAGLYLYTNSKGSNTDWHEAENMPYSVSEGAEVRIQPRSEISADERFNLWTGKGQLLFEPTQSDQSITFDIPVKKAGFYKIDTLVTVAPKYGKFIVEINGQPATISFPDIQVSEDGEYTSEIVKKDSFDAIEVTRDRKSNGIKDSIAGSYTVQRISLGVYESTGDNIRISFISKDNKEDGSLIGIDQFMVTERKSR
jgi:hypothetical protein